MYSYSAYILCSPQDATFTYLDERCMDGRESRLRCNGEKFMSSGDLGLGYGLKPGGISIDHTNNDDNSNSDSNTTVETDVPCEEIESADSSYSSYSLLSGDSLPVGELDYIGPVSEKTQRFVNLLLIREKLSNALSQRWKLRLRRASSTTGETPKDQRVKSFRNMLKRRDNRQGSETSSLSDAEVKLENAHKEIKILTEELDALKLQNNQTMTDCEAEGCCAVKPAQSYDSLKQNQRKLQEEVNTLRWELETKKWFMMESEQTWADRFRELETGNLELQAVLQVRIDEIKKLNAEKVALARERDELVAALDVKDRLKYESSVPVDTSLDNPSIIELATLGACHCRGHREEPCACARAAVSTKKELVKLKQELDVVKKSREEAMLTIDAYRIAFEEQLNRNGTLLRDMASKSLHKRVWSFRSPRQRGETKPEEKIKEEDKEQDDLTNDEKILEFAKTHEDKMMQRLASMVSEKSEALAHQRLAAKMLATRILELEGLVDKLMVSDSSMSSSAS